MLKSVYIFNTDGLLIFQYTVEDDCCNNEERDDLDEIRFAGVSAAIKILLSDLGHKEIQSIHTSSGIIVYSYQRNLVFVAFFENKDYEKFGAFFIRQVEIEFLDHYYNIIDSVGASNVDLRLFEDFKEIVEKVYNQLHKIYIKEPLLFELIQPGIPLSILLSSIESEKDLLEGYPENTIKLVRQLYKKYSLEYPAYAGELLTAIGHFFGYKIKKRSYNKIVVSEKDLLTLLNEISVAKFDSRTNRVVLHICPVCRGFEAEQPICYFFTGFIEGVLNNPHLSVKETQCKAMGDKNCVFEITEENL